MGSATEGYSAGAALEVSWMLRSSARCRQGCHSLMCILTKEQWLDTFKRRDEHAGISDSNENSFARQRAEKGTPELHRKEQYCRVHCTL